MQLAVQLLVFLQVAEMELQVQQAHKLLVLVVVV
jgi:hypothetical protein